MPARNAAATEDAHAAAAIDRPGRATGAADGAAGAGAGVAVARAAVLAATAAVERIFRQIGFAAGGGVAVAIAPVVAHARGHASALLACGSGVRSSGARRVAATTMAGVAHGVDARAAAAHLAWSAHGAARTLVAERLLGWAGFATGTAVLRIGRQVRLTAIERIAVAASEPRFASRHRAGAIAAPSVRMG